MAALISADCLTRVSALLSAGGRRLLGLVGAPGSGKSTLAHAIAAAFPGRTIVVPMDGFHLANSELARLERAGRKGAPDTFDAAGYAALLQRLKRQGANDAVVYAPEFRREIEEAIAGAIAVAPDVPLVITEGNYLLLEQDAWGQVRTQLDEAWFVEVDDTLRRERLAQRHIAFGRSPQQAHDWVMRTDEPNARLVQASAHRADRRVRW